MVNLKNTELLRNRCLIDANWVGGAGEVIEVKNPATGEIVGTVPSLGAAEIEQAVAAAETAFRLWSALAAKERATILRGWS